MNKMIMTAAVMVAMMCSTTVANAQTEVKTAKTACCQAQNKVKETAQKAETCCKKTEAKACAKAAEGKACSKKAEAKTKKAAKKVAVDAKTGATAQSK